MTCVSATFIGLQCVKNSVFFAYIAIRGRLKAHAMCTKEVSGVIIRSAV